MEAEGPLTQNMYFTKAEKAVSLMTYLIFQEKHILLEKSIQE